MTPQELRRRFDRIDFAEHGAAPVVRLPDDFEVYDFTSGYDANRVLRTPYGIGRYAEKRKNMYVTEQFAGVRDIHVGIDFGAPAGTEVFSCLDGVLETAIDHARPGDYGPTLIVRHEIEGLELWALYGHLSRSSLALRKPGERVHSGEKLGWIGEKSENGGWNPHTHFQLSLVRPLNGDLPGAVSDEQLEQALLLYPDPRRVLGPVY